MAITKDQYEEAKVRKEEAENLIKAYHKQSDEDFKARWERFDKNNEYYKDEELRYSAGARCKCGAGLAYPESCDMFHQWTCADVLTGRRTDSGHEAFPFAFYEIKSEGQPSAHGATTRPSGIAKPI